MSGDLNSRKIEDTEHMKTRWIKQCLAAGVFAAGLTAGVAPAASLAVNWLASETSTTFAAQTGLPAPEYQSVAPDGLGQTVFVGNYKGAGVKAVGFRVMTSGKIPSSCVLYFTGTSGRQWTYPVQNLSADPTAWTTVVAPLKYGDGWKMMDAGATPALFDADIQSVAGIGVRFLRSGVQTTSFKISGFALLGGSSVAVATELYNFMVANTINDLSGDADGDGLSNWGEFLAGTSVRDAASAFVLEIKLDPAPNGMSLRWNNSKRAKFAVWQSSSLGGTFTRATPSGAWIQDEGSSISVPVDASSGSLFYRVEIAER